MAEPLAKLFGRFLRSDTDLGAGKDGAGIEPFFQLHETDPGLVVTGQDGALDRGGAPPPGQEREVNVHHRQLGQYFRLDYAPVSHHHAQLGTRSQDVGSLVHDR